MFFFDRVSFIENFIQDLFRSTLELQLGLAELDFISDFFLQYNVVVEIQISAGFVKSTKLLTLQKF